MKKVIDGGIESIEQLVQFISLLDEDSYQFIAKPAFEASIGQHLRHILDLYCALRNSEESQFVDYNIRRRGCALESDIALGIMELKEVLQWFKNLPEESLAEKRTVSAEVSVSTEKIVSAESTFARELCYTACHLTHHLSSMAAISRLYGHKTDLNYGVAPSTATFNRSKVS